MLQLAYFITNIFFVASLIAVLFLHRAVKLQQPSDGATDESSKKLARLKLIRIILLISTILFFISMCASFIANMKVNG